jgi:phosphoglycerate dehydrogenase-like enzyme
MVPHCDMVTINAPLHPETRGLFNDELLAKMRRGAYLINTARGPIADRDAIVRALEAANWPATPGMSGTRSPHRKITRGAPCHTTG